MIAGGRSRRFGSDKALALLDGRPLIEHAADALRGQTDALVVCGRRYADWPSLPDLPRPGLGPLGGIAAALDHAAGVGADRVVTIGCDMPSVSAETIAMLASRTPAFYVEAPILGCWTIELREPLMKLLEGWEGERGPAIRTWAIKTGARAIDGPMPANVNTPEDLAAL